MMTVRVRSEHPPVVHFPALSPILLHPVNSEMRMTRTIVSDAIAILPSFSASGLRDRRVFRSRTSWTDKFGIKQVVDSNAEINEAKLKSRQLRQFEIRSSPESVIDSTPIKPGFV